MGDLDEKDAIKGHNQQEENLKKTPSKQEDLARIFEETELRNKKPDTEKEKTIIRLINGEELDLNVLASTIQKHGPQFSQEFYNQIYRVYGLTGDPKAFRKDKVCADLTIEVIYSRFNKEVLPTIQIQNKYKGYMEREHKYYQFLTDEGILMLQDFIGDAIAALEKCNTAYDFRKMMFEDHKVAFQTDLFRQD